MTASREYLLRLHATDRYLGPQHDAVVEVAALAVRDGDALQHAFAQMHRVVSETKRLTALNTNARQATMPFHRDAERRRYISVERRTDQLIRDQNEIVQLGLVDSGSGEFVADAMPYVSDAFG